MNSADVERWRRLAGTLFDAGVELGGSTTPPLYIKTPKGNVVIIRDTWWSKNTDIWTGYQVELSGPDDITIKLWPRTKKRSEVRDAVLAALAEADFH
jgi:hypothetical protein